MLVFFFKNDLFISHSFIPSFIFLSSAYKTPAVLWDFVNCNFSSGFLIFCFKCKWQQMSWCLITSVWEIQLHDLHLFFRIMGDTHSQVLRSSSSICMGHSPPVLHAFPNPCFLKRCYLSQNAGRLSALTLKSSKREAQWKSVIC